MRCGRYTSGTSRNTSLAAYAACERHQLPTFEVLSVRSAAEEALEQTAAARCVPGAPQDSSVPFGDSEAAVTLLLEHLKQFSTKAERQNDLEGPVLMPECMKKVAMLLELYFWQHNSSMLSPAFSAPLGSGLRGLAARASAPRAPRSGSRGASGLGPIGRRPRANPRPGRTRAPGEGKHRETRDAKVKTDRCELKCQKRSQKSNSNSKSEVQNSQSKT